MPDREAIDARQMCCDCKDAIFQCLNDMDSALQNPDATLEDVNQVLMCMGDAMGHLQTFQAHYQQWKKELELAELDKLRAGG